MLQLYLSKAINGDGKVACVKSTWQTLADSMVSGPLPRAAEIQPSYSFALS